MLSASHQLDAEPFPRCLLTLFTLAPTSCTGWRNSPLIRLAPRSSSGSPTADSDRCGDRAVHGAVLEARVYVPIHHSQRSSS
jgi:hypothetical protein